MNAAQVDRFFDGRYEAMVAEVAHSDPSGALRRTRAYFACAYRFWDKVDDDGDPVGWVRRVIAEDLHSTTPGADPPSVDKPETPAVSGDHHSLPTMMATGALRDANSQVHHLGADTPSAELVRFCTEQPVDLAVLTVTNPDSIEVAEHTADTLRAAGIRAIVGGPGRTLNDLLDQARGALPSGRARPGAMRSVADQLPPSSR